MQGIRIIEKKIAASAHHHDVSPIAIVGHDATERLEILTGLLRVGPRLQQARRTFVMVQDFQELDPHLGHLPIQQHVIRRIPTPVGAPHRR